MPQHLTPVHSDADAAPRLSVVIPAYNEEARLAATLEGVLGYVEKLPFACELIVVDDGSTDSTAAICRRMCSHVRGFRLLGGPVNHGKGHAVRVGMLAATGDYVLMCDADLATPIEELDAFWRYIDAGADIVIASRPLRNSHLVRRQPIYREFAGRALNHLIQTVAVPGIHDTQCGFKLFRTGVAQCILSICSVDNFSFDIEVLHVAQKLGFTIVEAPVHWYHRPGSKVNCVRDGLRLVRDLFLIRLRHRRIPRRVCNET